MKVRGAYMTIKEFLYTFKSGAVYTEDGNNGKESYCLAPHRKLVIPDYQREYRWEDKQLTELFEDISSGNCYLGQIAVSHNFSDSLNYYLVDGQQRITSIIILLTVLCRQFYRAKDTINIQQFELHYAESNIDDPHNSRLSFEANCFQPFQNYISQIYNLDTDENEYFNTEDFSAPEKDSYNQAGRYVQACSVFNHLICQQLKAKQRVPTQLAFVKDLIAKILEAQISVVIFEGDNSYESEKVFLDINEKGLRLDDEDILKAYYFQSISGYQGQEALRTWTALKESFFDVHQSLQNSKMPLETFVNCALQTELLMQSDVFSYENFDDKLRYKGPGEKQHICQLFSNTDLHISMQRIVNFFQDICSLLEMDRNSKFYVDYFKGRDSTTREVFSLLFKSVCLSGMKIVYIALIKMWWLRARNNETLTLEDTIQLFSFYIISNVAALKKRKSVFSNEFLSAKSVEETYTHLHVIEIRMLKDAFSQSSTLKNDQEKAEYLSFNIQMFYNDFIFKNSRWEISISAQEFLEKYSSNRNKYIKDHFLIQNGKTIKLIDGNIFYIDRKMTTLRKRAYNFIFHEDTFGNDDFVSRLERIFSDINSTTGQNSQYGKYENAYFNFIKEEFCLFFKEGDQLPTWQKAVENYKSKLPDVFPEIISFILEEHSRTWNKGVCQYFENQFPNELRALAEE